MLAIALSNFSRTHAMCGIHSVYLPNHLDQPLQAFSIGPKHSLHCKWLQTQTQTYICWLTVKIWRAGNGTFLARVEILISVWCLSLLVMLQAAPKGKGVTHSFAELSSSGLPILRPPPWPPTPSDGLSPCPTQPPVPAAAQALLKVATSPPPPLRLSPTPPSSGWQEILQFPDGPKCPPRAVAVWRKWTGWVRQLRALWLASTLFSDTPVLFSPPSVCTHTCAPISASLIGKMPLFCGNQLVHWLRARCRCRCQCFELHLDNLVSTGRMLIWKKYTCDQKMKKRVTNVAAVHCAVFSLRCISCAKFVS